MTKVGKQLQEMKPGQLIGKQKIIQMENTQYMQEAMTAKTTQTYTQ